MTKKIAVVLFVALAYGVNGFAQDEHEHHHHGGTGEGAPPVYGQVHFQTSCTPEAQKSFETAVAELHSFEYSTAEAEFKHIQKEDGECAIAFWGEGMTLYHPLWNRLSETDLAEGWTLVKKAEAAKKTSAREKAYIAALAALYKPGKITDEDRATAYSEQMEKVHTAYPDDEEASVFYALSLLGAEPPSDTSLSYAKKAVAILNQVLAKDPNHPGVTHYIIHACDNPKMAPEALVAARQYAKIAPDSAHAVHMPSHIFSRLGLWQESINSNNQAIEIAKKQGEAVEYQLHPMDFLMYAYLQTGQDDKAKAVERLAVDMQNSGFGHGREGFYWYVQAHFPAMVAVETKDWKAAEALQPPSGITDHMDEMTYWAQAVGAGHLKDVPAAQKAVEKLEASVAAYEKEHPSKEKRPVNTDLNEAKAWLAYAQGKNEEAFALLKPVIERQDAVGKGEVELPAREMYAEMLLDTNHPKEALEQYKLSLQSDPNRFNGLYGAAHSAEMAGDTETAASYYAQLLKTADGSQRPELAHARQVTSGASAGE